MTIDFKQSILHQWIKIDFLRMILKNRETCRHWIDYEIYDYLTDELKEKYLGQFEVPQFAVIPSEKKYTVCCKANKYDSLGLYRCDCTKKYPKTLKQFKKKFELKGK
jgi:hypothetical protein